MCECENMQFNVSAVYGSPAVLGVCLQLCAVCHKHHITIDPWQLLQPSEASNLIKTEINLISDLPDEYDKTCSRLMDLDTYQGPWNHWSRIRGGRVGRGGVRGSKTRGGLVEAALERCLQAGLGWQPWLCDGPKLHAKPASFQFTHMHTYPLTHVTFCFVFPIFDAPILFPFASFFSLVDFFFSFLSFPLLHTHWHTGIWGIYKGVVELVELCFDAQWEITGPRSRDKSTTKTQVSALAYALQTHSHIRLHASITHVQRRTGIHAHTHTHVHTLTYIHI